jgi:hypothetical protein
LQLQVAAGQARQPISKKRQLVSDQTIHVPIATLEKWNTTACSTWNAVLAGIRWEAVLPDNSKSLPREGINIGTKLKEKIIRWKHY